MRGTHLVSKVSTQTKVYPRVCGGTVCSKWGGAVYSGLSPRVRGNLTLIHARLLTTRSIPACAGEPGQAPQVLRFDGSIPACAGEPLVLGSRNASGRVYPRVCGGTIGEATVCTST